MVKHTTRLGYRPGSGVLAATFLALAGCGGCGGSASGTRIDGSSDAKDGAGDGQTEGGGTGGTTADGGDAPSTTSDGSMPDSPFNADLGAAPTVMFVAPAATVTTLCANGATTAGCQADGDAIAPGWQGMLGVKVTVAGMPAMSGTVTFAADVTVLGTATINATGDATIMVLRPGVPEGNAVTITATADIAGRNLGRASRTFRVNVTPPPIPGDLTVLPYLSDQERRDSTFRLKWQAPTDAVGGSYDIRYAPVTVNSPDCSAFDFSKATPVSAPPTPASTAGATEIFAVTKLLIETTYCFGVQAKSAAGAPGTLMKTTMPARREFHRTILVPKVPNVAGGEVANERFGFWADGSGDVDGNGKSDLLVGAVANLRAYLILGGTSNFPLNDLTLGFSNTLPAPGSAAASNMTVFQGTSLGFGGSVAFIGNFDGDGLPEIAISARQANKVFIYKGRAVWPPTVTEAQADWVIQTDTAMDRGYTIVDATMSLTPQFGVKLARVGNFDGDAAGTDDFAIGVPWYPWNGTNGYDRRGRVVVVRGQRDTRMPGAGPQTVITLPDATRSIVIDGEMGLTAPNFGNSLVGLGRYYADGAGTTLVVGAPGFLPTSSPGRIYAYRWQAAGGGTLGASPAQVLTQAMNAGAKYGNVLINLGVMRGTLPGLAIGNTADTPAMGASGSVYVQGGDATAGPFGARSILYSTATPNIGHLVFGGGVSGGGTNHSVIGGATDSVPDIGIAGLHGLVYLIDGTKMLGTAAPLSLNDALTLTVLLPADWQATAIGAGGLIPDINGDGVADFALSDALNPGQSGRVLVFW
jgi:hypothetical protein